MYVDCILTCHLFIATGQAAVEYKHAILLVIHILWISTTMTQQCIYDIMLYVDNFSNLFSTYNILQSLSYAATK